MAFTIVFALLLGTAGACVTFALQITTLKSEIASLKIAQNNYTDTLEEEVHQLSNSTNMLYKQLSQQNASIDSAYQQLNEQLNTYIDMLHQQLMKQNSSIDSAHQQLSETVSQHLQLNEQLNTSIDMLYHQLIQQNSSFDSAHQQLNAQQLKTSIQLNEQLNTTIDMLYQQLNQQNQQLRQEYTALDNRSQQLNSSTQLLLNGLEGPGGQYPFYPAASCAALPPSSPSGYYWVRASDGSAVSVYCDMTLSCGGVTGGWMRVAELDMTNSSHQCPSGLRQRTDSGQRTCVNYLNSAGCSSVTFPMISEYSKVCGKIIAYQVGSTDSFYNGMGLSIDTFYVDGVSLTHGNPRQHIWTFASGLDEAATWPHLNCLCTHTPTANEATPSPTFVGTDYFCDTGITGHYQDGLFYGDDPLWDGAGCGPQNTCCSFNNPLWFYKQLPQSTSDDIEMRVCRDQTNIDEDTAIERVNIFIQ